MSEKRSSFGSRFGTIAVLAGSAVGLGNVWKFPYMAGENGGAAFILIYLLVSVLIAVPVLLAEYALGRRGQSNIFGSFRNLAPKQKGWHAVGLTGVVTAFLILSFYAVIAGWSLYFLWESATGSYIGMNAIEISDKFHSFVAQGWGPAIWALVFLAMTGGVLILGVNKGIERCSKLMMPMLLVLLVGLAVGSCFMDGWREGMDFLLRPDWSKVTTSTVIAAMGQAFFSLSLGMGAMATYGSYIDRKENLYGVASTVAVADVCVALLAGLAIFPAVFTYGISPTAGPQLVFVTLPSLFAQMPAGAVVAVVFFLLLFFAAITSAFSMMEVVVAYLSEEFGMSRTKAMLLSLGGMLALSMLCVASQTEGSGLMVGGQNLLDFLDTFTSNVLLPLSGLSIVIFMAWVLGRKALADELTTGGRYARRLAGPTIFLLRYVVPLMMVVLILNLLGIV